MIRRTLRPPRTRALLIAALIALTVGGLAFGAGTAAAQDDNTVIVTVVDENDDPVEGATVTLDGTVGETDADGDAVLEVADGTYELQAIAPGHEAATETVTIDGDESITVEMAQTQDVDEIRDALDALQERATELQAETEDLEQERDELRQERDELQEQFDEQQDQLDDLQAQIDDLQNESLPGFGPIVALVALLSIGAVAAYRR